MSEDAITRTIRALRISGFFKLADEVEGPLRMAVQEAEWFRWLRDNALFVDAVGDPNGTVIWYNTEGPDYYATGKTLQDAITKAVK